MSEKPGSGVPAEQSVGTANLAVTLRQRREQSDANRQQLESLLQGLPRATYRGIKKDDAMKARVTAEIRPTSARQRARIQRHVIWNPGCYVNTNPLPWLIIGARQDEKKTELLVANLAASNDSDYKYGMGLGGDAVIFRRYVATTFSPRIQTCKVDTSEWRHYQAAAPARLASLLAAQDNNPVPEAVTERSQGNLHVVRTILHREASAPAKASAESLTIKGAFSDLEKRAELDNANMAAFNVQAHLDYLSDQLDR